MNVIKKSIATDVTTVGTALLGASFLLHENLMGMLYTGMAGIGGAALGAAFSVLETDHRKILRNQFIGAAACIGLTTAIIETHPHHQAYHNDDVKVVQLNSVPTQRIPANTYTL